MSTQWNKTIHNIMTNIQQFFKNLNEQWYFTKRAYKIRRSHRLYQHDKAFREANEERLRSLKGRYEGKRIFIVCNGPSLKPEDLERIYENGDYSFGCNRVHFIFPKTHWRPTFYTMMDIGPLKERHDLMRDIEAKQTFYRMDTYTTIRDLNRDVTLLNTLDTPDLLEHPKFSEDCSKIIYFIETTTYCMLQLAAYMGFKEMYIIGCDNNYSVNVLKDGTRVQTGAHSYFEGFGDKHDDQTAVSRIWAFNIAYETARKYADTHGIKIMNATRGGYLEAFERVDFDSLFK